MTFFKLERVFFVFSFLGLYACSLKATDPRSEDTKNVATFAIIPDSIRANAELTTSSVDNYGHPNAQVLHFIVCLQNLASGQNVPNGTPFSISDGTSAAEITREAQIDGCIRWNETHVISYFSEQNNIRIQRQIRGLGNHHGKVILSFNVKPWKEGTDAVQSDLNQETYTNSLSTPVAFGFSEAYPISQKSRAELPKIELADNNLVFHYEEIAQEKDFYIDSYLNLRIPYRFTFSFKPLVIHRMNSGESHPENISLGRLQVTFVFFASGKGDPREDSYYLSSTQVDAKLSANGQFTGSAILKYPHMLFASGRQTILMQISPLDKGSSIQGQSFSGNLSYIDQQGSIIMLPDPREAESIHTKNQLRIEERVKARSTPLQEFIGQRELQKNQINEFPSIQDIAKPRFYTSWENLVLTHEELQYALAQDHLSNQGFRNLKSSLSVRARLCRAYLTLNPVYGNSFSQKIFEGEEYLKILQKNGDYAGGTFCDEEVLNKHVKIEVFDFVEKLTTNTPRNVNIVSYGNQEFGIYYSKEHSRGSTEGFVLKFPGNGALGGILDVFTYSQFDSHSLLEKGNFGTTQQMAVDLGDLEVNAVIRSCVLISNLDTKISNMQKPWLICESENQPAKWIKENFFYYSQIFSSIHSPFIDPYNAQTGVKVFIRGRSHMQNILHTLQRADFQNTGFNVFVQAHIPRLDQLEVNQNLDMLTEQDIPGAFTRN